MRFLVELKSVAQRYGSVDVFSDVSLEMRSGDHLALLGPSGCGKSTLLRLVAGLEAPGAGEVWLHADLASAPGRIIVPPHERGVAMVFQDLALWPNLTVLENVVLGLAGARLERSARRARARSALERCGIIELGERRPAALSGGQQQRVALARALAVEPKLLLLDEPFSGLDLTSKAQLTAEILRLTGTLELTLLLVTHDPLEAAALCSHVAVLEGGRIGETGAFESVLRDPVSATLRAFVAQLPPALRRAGTTT
jgi:ABC-type Fe3+/spermidine/putrescine transport system ATPase subunit